MLSRNKLQVLLYALTTLLFGGAGLIALINLVPYVRSGIFPDQMDTSQWALYSAICFTVWLLDMILFSRNRNLTLKGVFRIIAERLCMGAIMMVMFSVLAILSRSALGARRRLLVCSCLAYAFATLIGTLILRVVVRRLYKTRFSILTGIITVTDRAPAMIDALHDHWTRKLVGIALMDRVPAGVGAGADGGSAAGFANPPERINGVPVKAGPDNFVDWVRTESLDEVYIDLPIADGLEFRPYLEEIQSMGTVIHLNATVVDNLTADGVLRLDKEFKVLAGHPMLTFCLARHNPWALMVKRIADILIGLAGSILSLPIIGIVAVPLLIESPGPLIFKQKRMGKNGRVFNVYKLRSMYKDAEARKAELMSQNEMNGLMFKMKDDPRITKVGKFIRKTSIDELPQFWNILKGDMSFVGTRPPTLAEYEQYSSHHKRRLSMKPGLTGMWQVSGRSEITDFEEVVKLDTQYIDNWSLTLDLQIMLKTVKVVLTRKGSE